MLIKIVATGAAMHVPTGQMTDAMIASGIWERVVVPSKPVEVKWFLFKELENGLHSLGFNCGWCKSTSYFAPDVNLGAEKLLGLLRPHCSHRTTCPAELINSYLAAGGGQPIPKYELNGAAENKEQAESLSRPRKF